MFVLCECEWMTMSVVIFLSLIETIFDGALQSVCHQNYFFQNFLKYTQLKTFLPTRSFDQKFLIFQTNKTIHSHISSLLERQRTLCQSYWLYHNLLMRVLKVINSANIHVGDNCGNQCNIDNVTLPLIIHN